MLKKGRKAKARRLENRVAVHMDDGLVMWLKDKADARVTTVSELVRQILRDQRDRDQSHERQVVQ